MVSLVSIFIRHTEGMEICLAEEREVLGSHWKGLEEGVEEDLTREWRAFHHSLAF